MKTRFLKPLAVLSFVLSLGWQITAISPASAILEDDLRDINLGAPIYFGGDTQQCVGGANIDIGIDFNLGTEPRERRVNLIRALMADFDLTPQQAAGIVGNFMAESGGDHLPPDVNEGLTNNVPQWVIDANGPGPPREVVAGVNTGGYGWAQWTGGRKTSFIDFAIERGYVPSAQVNFTDAANYAYLVFELTQTNESDAIDAIKEESTPEDAAITFMLVFERPGIPHAPRRTAGAAQAFEEYDGSGPLEGGGSCPGGPNSAAISGDFAFPLLATKSTIENPGMFRNGTSDIGGHPYIAYDILVPPDTPVAAFLDGTVTSVSADRCPGRLISIYNEESDLTVSYLHLSFNNHVGMGENVSTGEQIGVIGSSAEGCGTPHLHIDVVNGKPRPPCSRNNCPPANKARFVDIGPQLYETFQLLVD